MLPCMQSCSMLQAIVPMCRHCPSLLVDADEQKAGLKHVSPPGNLTGCMPVSVSLVTAAVRPTPEEPRPVVDTARAAMLITARSSCDLATPGSPTWPTPHPHAVCVRLHRLHALPDSALTGTLLAQSSASVLV